jgi:hypothetical protein
MADGVRAPTICKGRTHLRSLSRATGEHADPTNSMNPIDPNNPANLATSTLLTLPTVLIPMALKLSGRVA